jgi:hypothetical protein
MSSTTTSSEKTYAHFPDLQAARRRARDAEVKAFEAFQATEETRLAAVKAAETIYRAALAAADAAAKETRITYETAAAAARTAEKTLDKARVEAGGRRPVRYQVSDDIGQRAFEKMIADRTYSTMLPADTSYYPHSSTEFLARMHAEGVEVNSNICDMWAWRNLKEIKNGDILYLVTSSNAHDWVPSKIYKGAVRSGPVHTLEANYGRDYQNHRNPTTSLKMTWEVSWRLLSDYDETYKDCFIDLTNGAAAVKITKPLPLPIASGALPPATEV